MKKPSRRLELVLDYGGKVQDFLEGKNLVDWRHDLQLRYAVAHALAGVVENVKEYVQSTGFENIQQQFPDIPWKQIIRFRDKMTHHYEVIDQDALYEFATLQLPELLHIVRIIIGQTTHPQGPVIDVGGKV